MNLRALDRDQLQPLVPFKDLIPSHLEQLIDESRVLYLFAGDVLFEQGQYDDVHYYLLSGELRARDGARHYRHHQLFPLAPAQPRDCTLMATTECCVLQVARRRLDELLTWSQAAEYLLLDLAMQRERDEDAEWIATLLQSNLFLKVPPINVAQIIGCLEPHWVHAGEVILRQGELGDCCYFIKQGRARVSRRDSSQSEPHQLADIERGRCFGEDALLQETVRNATVHMLSDGVLMRLQKTDFLQLLRQPEVPCVSWRGFMARQEEALIIDVRTESEYRRGHLRRAVNIPLNLLRLKGRLLEGAGPCLVYCDSGRRSAVAACFLRRQGLQAAALAGGLLNQQEQEQQQTAAPPGAPAAANIPALASVWTQQDYLLRGGRVARGQVSDTT